MSAQVSVRDEIKQPTGLVHGGVYASIAEAMASLATALAVQAEGGMAMGLSNSTSFCARSQRHGARAGARLHRGRTTWVWDVRFSDDAERLCAITRMTIAVRPAPAGEPAAAALTQLAQGVWHLRGQRQPGVAGVGQRRGQRCFRRAS